MCYPGQKQHRGQAYGPADDAEAVWRCHGYRVPARTPKTLPEECREADIIIAAIGKPDLVTADMVKPGAVVIDVGTTRVPDATQKKRIPLKW